MKEYINRMLRESYDDWDDDYEYGEEKYSLIGQDGNAFSLMGYTARAMKECGLRSEIDEMHKRATESDYYHLIAVCDEYIQKCNEIAKNGGLDEGYISTIHDYSDTIEALKKQYADNEARMQELVQEYSALQSKYHGDSIESKRVEIDIDNLSLDQEAIKEKIKKLGGSLEEGYIPMNSKKMGASDVVYDMYSKFPEIDLVGQHNTDDNKNVMLLFEFNRDTRSFKKEDELTEFLDSTNCTWGIERGAYCDRLTVIAPEDEDLEESYKLNEEDEEEDTTFGDPSDMKLTGDTEKDFETLVKKLRETSFEDLGDELEDILNDPKLYALLDSGFGDGENADVRMSSDVVYIPVAQLLPSQSEIGLENSLSFQLKSDVTSLFDDEVMIVSPIVTYRKTFVIDGHHRWSQVYMINPDAKIAAINFNYNNPSPFRALRNFQGAVAVAREEVPKEYSKVNNVYDMSEKQIRKYISDNIQDICWESLVNAGVCEDKESAIDYILGNALMLARENPPFENAPDREYMPQTDEKTLEVAEEGQTNI